jgi:hypothetical protein
MQEKKMTFKTEPDWQLKYCHNLIAQTKYESREYDPSEAMPMARLMNDYNIKIIKKGVSFAQ